MIAVALVLGILSAAGDVLPATVASDPENLRLAADYRQRAIAAGDFDRSIELFEQLAKRKGSGPNVHISLALAYIDKVPTSGDIRRLYLGRDAISAATRSIERRPSVLAYYIRGVVNLYYNNFIFHRIPRGIADLQQALALITADTPATLAARVYASLGDGYWRLGQRDKAREIWQRGLERFATDARLTSRLVPNDRDVDNIVSDALYAGNRVDTSLRGVVP
jgi:tetratricopeptide (TPR) repeat protein